jgi:hypothetical protein
MIDGGSRRMDDRAVSEALGYILVFAVVVASIATVTTVGVGGLQEQREAEQFTNVQRAFDVFAENLDDVRRYDDPRRATEIRLAGGSLRFGEQSNVTVGVHDGSDFVGNTTRANVTPIAYVQDDESVVYEAGALFRTKGGSSVMLREPEHVPRSDRASLSIVHTYPGPESGGIGGEGTVLVVGEQGTRFPVDNYEPGAGEEVRIVVESARAPAWERYFDARAGFTVVGSETTDETVVATVDGPPDEVVVAVTRIRLNLRQ